MMTDKQIERFSRQIILREVGVHGQQRLSASKVLFVGLPAAAATAVAYLAAAGAAEIGLVDDEVVANPAAPLAYCETDRGQPRSRLAAHLVATLQPDGRARTYANPAVAFASRSWDLAVFGGGTAAALCNAATIAARLPGIVVSADTDRGWLAGVAGHRTDAPCWRCADWAPWLEAEGSASNTASALPGVIGAALAIEATKSILEIGTPIAGRLLLWEPGCLAARVTALEKNPGCAACARRRT